MFCKNCGQAVSEGSKFCASCGAALCEAEESNVTNGALDKEALKRKVDRLIDKYNIYPDVSAADAPRLDKEFDGSYADTFDPFYCLRNLKTAVNDCLLETTEYKYDISTFDDVINDTYNKRIPELKNKIRDYIFSCFESREENLKYVYSDMLDLRTDEFRVYFFARVMTKICCDIKDVEGLIKARMILKMLDNFYCEKNTDTFEKIYASGHMLSLSQFRKEKMVYDALMQYIEKTALEIDPKTKEVVSEYLKKDKNSIKRTHNKRKRQSAINIIVRLILALLSPLFLYLSYNIAIYLGVDFAEIPLKLTLIVAAILCVIIFICDLICKNIPAAVLITVGGSALLYPICWITVVAVQIIVIGLIIFVLCFTPIGSKRL